MSDFERSGDRAGVTYDEPARRRTPGTFFADLGDRLARGFNSFDRPQPDEGEWEDYEELDQPTQAVDSIPPSEPSRRRFQTVLHGYDRDAVDDYIDGLEHEIGQMAAKLSAQRSAPAPAPAPSVEDEIARVGQETSAILRVAHEQAAEITRRARAEAERCVADAASNAVAMTDDAKRKLRQLDSETDAVWTERIRLIEDVRNVATSLFSLAEDACDRFPEEGDRGGATASASATQAAPQATPAAQPNGASAPDARSAAPAPAPAQGPAPATPAASSAQRPATVPPAVSSAQRPATAPPAVSSAQRPATAPPAATPPPVAAQNHRPPASPDESRS
ncbi:MAG: DivIVA domain-containing protein [Solirubrobacteraceae bacterium]